MATAARPEMPAHAEAMRLPFQDLVAELRNLLGPRLVAYIGSVKETRAVHQWSEGSREPDVETKRRLRDAFVVARMLVNTEPPAVVQAWFQGLNPALDDRSPARLLREGDLDDVSPQVIGAARVFLAHG
ncbi:MAG: hypothetical protein ACRDQ2_16055 [Gaiellales bacterium]